MEGRRGGLTCQQAIALFEVNVDHTYGKLSWDRPDGYRNILLLLFMPLLNPFGVWNASHFFFGLHPELFKFISHHRVLSVGFK